MIIEDYVKKSKGRLFTTAYNSKINMERKSIRTWKQTERKKQLYGYFKRQTIRLHAIRYGQGKEKLNLMRETEPLLTSAQNNAIRTNHVKAKIDDITK